MDSRERTFLALGFEEPDKVPVDFWVSRAFAGKLESAIGMPLEGILDAYDVDLRYIPGPGYIGPPLEKHPDGSLEDIWGVRRRAVLLPVRQGGEIYEEVVQSPLASATTIEEIDAFGHWPSPDWFDYEGIEAQCQQVLRGKRVVVFQGDRLNRIAQLKPAMYLRGVQLIFEDMALRPELAQAIFSHVRSFYCEYLERILVAANGGLDIVLTGDDFGAQNGPLVSPGMWVDLLGQGFADYTAIVKGQGVRAMHHTCGAVRPLISLMMDRGLDVLQSLQPEAAAMDPRSLKAEFGGRLAFHGGISVQRTLPLGTPEDVRNEVRDRVEALGAGGGYILCTSHNIQADTPIENAMELLKAYRECGSYR